MGLNYRNANAAPDRMWQMFSKLICALAAVALGDALSCPWGSITTLSRASEITLSVTITEPCPAETPLVFRVPTQLASIEHLELIESGREPIAVQWYQRQSGLAAFVLPRQVKAGEQLRFAIRKTPTPAIDGVRATVSNDNKYLSLFVRDKEVLQYAMSVRQPPPGIEAVYAHSGHIHPLFTPNGKVVTAEFPADHAHQHGIFNAWVSTTFEGRKLDFWNQKEQSAKVEHAHLLSCVSGPVFAEFVVEMLHADLIAPGGAQPVLKDVWTVRAWRTSSGYLVDLESRQTCVAQSPLVVEEYHYGGMSFRGREEWLGVSASRFITSEGKNRADGNHSRPRWVAIEGELDGSECSVAIMGHPDNSRHPEPVRLHPNKPYFVFTPPQLGRFELLPGKEHVSRYRYWVTDNLVDSKLVDSLWRAYSNPPKISFD